MKRRLRSPSPSDRAALGVTALLCAALPALGAVSCQSAPSAQATAVTASPARPSAPRHPPLSLEYVEATTAGAAADAPLPLLVAVHGLGDRPENFIMLFSDFPARARVVAPHSRTPFSDGYQWFAPIGPMSDEAAPALAQAGDDVAAFATEAAKAFPTLGKPILVGFSQGGAISYTVAVRHPGAIAASVPIGGWLPPPLWPHELPHVAPRIFAFHGRVDPRVPLERDRAGAEALQNLGFDIHFEAIDGVEHAIPPPVRDRAFAVLVKACDEQRTRGKP